MDRQYLEEQIILLASGEETDLEETEIRKHLESDPELMKKYQETLSIVKAASARSAPEVSSSQWREFSSQLRERTVERRAGVLVKIAALFSTPARAGAFASAAAILLIGLFLALRFGTTPDSGTPVGKTGETGGTAVVSASDFENVLEGAPPNLETVSQDYAVADGLLPTAEEMDLTLDVYATFSEISGSVDAVEELQQQYDYEDLIDYTVEKEDIS